MQRLKVSVSCPSCGAPFEFLEGANVARCSFCNLPLLFQSLNKILRYYLEPKLSKKEIPFLIDRFRKEKGEPLSGRIGEIKLYHLPFWRFTSEVFYTTINLDFPDSYQEDKGIEILTKDWDINLSADLYNDFGIATLGMRPDWLKLKLLADNNLLKEGEILNLDLNPSSAKKKAVKSLYSYIASKKSAEEELVIKLLEENLSLIYFPLWVANFETCEGKYFQTIDGITRRILKQGSGCFELKKNEAGAVESSGQLKIVPHRCPDCGWDLPVTPFHLIFHCENCGKIWKISENGYQPITGVIAKAKEGQKASSSELSEYYPFWVFEARLQEGKKFSIQNLLELFPSEIGFLKAKDKSRPFLFYVPAFEIKNLNKIPGISLAFTRTQPDLEIEPGEKANLRGVSISEKDAKKLAELLWICFISSKMNLDFEKYKDLVCENEKLVWLPFYEEGIFLRDAVIGYAFQNVR